MGSMHTQGKDHVGTQKEGGHMQAKERDFETNPTRTFIMDSQLPEVWEIMYGV